jgi:ATP:ADP antiporter, AAA family
MDEAGVVRLGERRRRLLEEMDDRLRAEIQKLHEAGLRPAPAETDTTAAAERVSQIISDLASRDIERIGRGLDRAEPSLATFVIPLLASPDVGARAMKVLAAFGTSITGQLADALLDRSRCGPAVRRRLVRVVAESKNAWAAAALSAALDDPELEVRRQVVRSLEDIANHGVSVTLDHSRLLASAIEELRIETVPAGERVDHALRLLGLIFERDAFRLARMALNSGDDKLRGTGLEYLENVLPDQVRAALFAALAMNRAPTPRRPERELLDELKRSRY